MNIIIDAIACAASIEAAQAFNLLITHVTETHHADFLSGPRELAHKGRAQAFSQRRGRAGGISSITIASSNTAIG